MTTRTVAELLAELVELLPPSGVVSFSVVDIREMLATEAALNTEDAANDTTVLVPEAAALAGVNEETVRRAVRKGEITGLRSNPNGTIRVRTRDIDFLKGKARKPPKEPSTDAAAHAVASLARL